MSTPDRIPSRKDGEIISSQSSYFLRMSYWNVFCYCELEPAHDLGYQFGFCRIELWKRSVFLPYHSSWKSSGLLLGLFRSLLNRTLSFLTPNPFKKHHSSVQLPKYGVDILSCTKEIYQQGIHSPNSFFCINIGFQCRWNVDSFVDVQQEYKY